MKDYLQVCVSKEDWHGVADAAMDIREIVAVMEYICDHQDQDGLKQPTDTISTQK